MLRRKIGSVVLALVLSAALAGPALPALAANPGVVAAKHHHPDPCDGRHIDGDDKCAPEAPLPIGLPLAGLAVFGGYVWLVRRRRDVTDELQPG